MAVKLRVTMSMTIVRHAGFEIHRWNGVRTAVLTLVSGAVRTRHHPSQELLEHHACSNTSLRRSNTSHGCSNTSPWRSNTSPWRFGTSALSLGIYRPLTHLLGCFISEQKPTTTTQNKKNAKK